MSGIKMKMYQNLQDAAKIVLRGKLIALNSYTTKEKYQISKLIFHLKDLDKEEKNEPKKRKTREIMISVEIKKKSEEK